MIVFLIVLSINMNYFTSCYLLSSNAIFQDIQPQQPTYQIQPKPSEEFPGRAVYYMIQRTLTTRLESEEYSAETAAALTKELAHMIQSKAVDSMHFIQTNDSEVT